MPMKIFMLTFLTLFIASITLQLPKPYYEFVIARSYNGHMESYRFLVGSILFNLGFCVLCSFLLTKCWYYLKRA